MNLEKETARICDRCGELYEGVSCGVYKENICDACLSNNCSLPLITEDVKESEIPLSVFDEFDGGRDEDDEY